MLHWGNFSTVVECASLLCHFKGHVSLLVNIRYSSVNGWAASSTWPSTITPIVEQKVEKVQKLKITSYFKLLTNTQQCVVTAIHWGNFFFVWCIVCFTSCKNMLL